MAYQRNLGHVLLDANNLIAELDDLLERGAGGDRVDEQEALAVAVVAVTHDGVLLLTGGIEDVEEARLVVDGNGLAIDVLNGG